MRGGGRKEQPGMIHGEGRAEQSEGSSAAPDRRGGQQKRVRVRVRMGKG